MPDHFAALDQPRRAWLDPEALKDAFHRLSARVHPDVAGTGDAARFGELNAAYAVLREPATRLRHLLQLIAPDRLTTQSPPSGELADLFMRFGAWQQRASSLLAKQKAATSPLARALLAADDAAVRRELAALLLAIEAAWAEADVALRQLESLETHNEISELARWYHRVSYLTRWREQAREAALRFEA